MLFSDKLVPVPNSEGGSYVIPGQSVDVPLVVPDGASAVVLSDIQGSVSVDGAGVVMLPYDFFSKVIYGRHLIDAIRISNPSRVFVQFFKAA